MQNHLQGERLLLFCKCFCPIAPSQEIKFEERDRVEEVGGAEKKEKPAGFGTQF